ncbi:MAG: PEP-CTERM sorting domain-containing protein [Phycisphaerae bacterium]
MSRMRALLALSLMGGFATMASAAILINEVRIDHAGTDTDEYFELSGNAGESLAGLTYIVIGDGTNASGNIERIIPLSGSIPADGYFLGAGDTTINLLPVLVDQITTPGTDLFENSDNVTHMIVSGFTGVLNSDVDANNDGVFDATFWTSIVDSIALVEVPAGLPTATDEWYYGPNTIGPDGSFVPGHIWRFGNGNGPWQIGQFALPGGADTPGVANLPEPSTLALLALAATAIIRRR